MKVAVTGAYGYSGKYIAERLLQRGDTVITLTNSLHRENSFGDTIEAFPFNFNNPEMLIASLQGVDVLINTYWVRTRARDNTPQQVWKRLLANIRTCFSYCATTNPHLSPTGRPTGARMGIKHTKFSQIIRSYC